MPDVGQIADRGTQAQVASVPPVNTPPPDLSEPTIDAAYAQVRADTSIQFDFPPLVVEPTEPSPFLMSVFKAIARFIEFVGSGWVVLMWAAVALMVAVLVFRLFPPARNWLARLRARWAADKAELARWAPQVEAAHALLNDADQLAAAGRFDEAVRLLLHRSIEDIERWRGRPLPRSYTSRDIRALDTLTQGARTVFSRIVAEVERSLFAGHPLGEADWHQARQDYAGFALNR